MDICVTFSVSTLFKMELPRLFYSKFTVAENYFFLTSKAKPERSGSLFFMFVSFHNTVK